ncbi:MAG TPA: hypothetical protein VF119_08485 [Candidatus Limnocylindrales bacterium]
MKRSRRIGRVAAVLTAATMAVAIAAPVAAAPLEQGTFHEEFSFVDPDLCGAGLEVRVDVVVDGRFLVTRRGRDGLVYGMGIFHQTQTYTNLANSLTVTSDERTIQKDHHVTDNGDGTLTVRILATGNYTLYGADGRAIARNPGQVRFELLIDHGGTPDDPSDDVELDFSVIKESTGRSDDACDAAVPALT